MHFPWRHPCYRVRFWLAVCFSIFGLHGASKSVMKLDPSAGNKLNTNCVKKHNEELLIRREGK